MAQYDLPTTFIDDSPSTPLSAAVLNEMFEFLAVPLPSGGDDSVFIQAQIDAAAISGGDVSLGPGRWIGQGLIVRDGVHIWGVGQMATIIQLADNANEDLFITEDFATYDGGTTRGGPEHFGFHHLTLDGNRDNNVSGWALRIFGAAYVIDSVEIMEGASGGVQSQWGTGGTDMEALWSNFRIHDCDGDGLDWQGPHDSAFMNGFVFKNTGDGIKTGGNATSELFTNVHCWGTEQNWAWYLGNAAFLANCQGEGASLGQVMAGAPCQIVGGTYFGTGVGAEVGIQIGDATSGSVSSVGVLGVYLKGFSTTGLPLNFYDSGGGNTLQVTMIGDVAVTVINGTPDPSDEIRIRSSTTSIANQSIFRQYGIATIDAPGGAAANTAFTIKNSGGQDRFNFNAATPKFEINAAGQIVIYAGVSYTDQMMLLDGDGFMEFTALAAAPSAPATGFARLYALDEGGGKTGLYVRFPTGSPIQIEVEP